MLGILPIANSREQPASPSELPAFPRLPSCATSIADSEISCLYCRVPNDLNKNSKGAKGNLIQ